LRPDGLAGFEGYRQFFVLHLYELGGVFGEVGVLGQHHGDGLAHVAHPVARQDGLQKGVEIVLGPGANRYRAGLLEVLTGQYRLDPGEGESPLRFHATKARVGERGPHNPHPQLPRKAHVVDEVTQPAKQAAVFEATDPLADGAH
jgi:hypothetical protein